MAAPWLDNFRFSCEEAYIKPPALTVVTYVLSVSTIATKND